MIKQLYYNLSTIAVLGSDSENKSTKKIALTLLPIYVSLPAAILAFMYLYIGNINAFYIPVIYIAISVLSLFYLYKTKQFFHYEMIQLTMILFLPFILMWVLGGFNAGSFVFIWAFYAPIAASIYNENMKLDITWFFAFILLLLISTYFDAHLIATVDNKFPILILDIFFFINIGAGLGGIYFLVAHFINKIKVISLELKRDRESLYILTNDLKNVNKELEQLANCDLVTELPNKLFFQDTITSVFHKADINKKRVALLFLDLDGFKAINDTLGHEAGDMVLKVVGTRLKAVVRDSDIVARIGGDEFAIALGSITETRHVEQISKTIIKEVNELCHYNGKECRVGVSIGISFYPDHGKEVDELMKKADIAMYETKKAGKNNYSIYLEEPTE